LQSLGALPSPIPDAAHRPDVIGRWDRIPLGTRESEVKRLLLTADEVVWVGTSNGLAIHDGDTVGVLPFAKTDEATVLIVNELVELGAGAVLVGTINGTLWKADRQGLRMLVDLGNRAEFSFLRRSDGRVEVASSFGLRLADDYARVTNALADLKLAAHVRREELSRMVEIGGRLFGMGRSGTLYELYDDDRPPHPVAEIKGPALHMTSLGSEAIVIATYDGCYAVPVDDPAATIERSKAIARQRRSHKTASCGLPPRTASSDTRPGTGRATSARKPSRSIPSARSQATCRAISGSGAATDCGASTTKLGP
jgi:hypothetical protein